MSIKKILLAIASVVATSSAMAGAVHDAALFTGHTLAANDDGSTPSVSIGFSADFFGSNYANLFVNNNGNVTFTNPLSTFTPFGLTTNSFPIIAPFFADVDTNNPASGVTQYGSGTLAGHNVFGVNWINVGYFPSQSNLLNSFQLILIDRSDIGAGDFDIEFNYDKIQWETGSASGGTGGFGGTSAAAGYTDGGANDFEFAGSRVHSAFLDSNPGGLIHGSRNSNILGQYVFNVRNGAIEPVDVPEPATIGLVGIALAGMALARRRQQVK